MVSLHGATNLDERQWIEPQPQPYVILTLLIRARGRPGDPLARGLVVART